MIAMLFPPAFAGLSLLLTTAAAATDCRTRRVPDAIVALVLIPTALAVLLSGDPTQTAISALLGAALMAMPLLILHLAAPASMGFGDVKLAAALGAAIGLLAPMLA